MPPRPGAVATATMVSVVLNTAIGAAGRLAAYFGEMTTVFKNASPMLSDVTPASSDTAKCTMRRA